MSRTRLIANWTVAVLLAAVAGFLICARTSKAPILFYYGASIDVPQGTVISILNPFRDRTSEHTAERLIKDLRSARCEQILPEFRSNQFSDPSRICPVVQRAKRCELIWREDGQRSKTLVYNLADQRARLWIYFNRGEDGFGVDSVSLMQ